MCLFVFQINLEREREKEEERRKEGERRAKETGLGERETDNQTLIRERNINELPPVHGPT